MKAKKNTSNINHHAHFYGGVFGVVYSLLIKPEAVFSFWRELSQWQFSF